MALADIPPDLVQRCQRGDDAAYDALFRAIRDDLFRWIFSLVRSEEDTEEILQECLIRIFRHLPRLQDPNRFAAWTSRMVVNQVNTWRVRARKTRMEALEEGWEAPREALPLQGSPGPGPRAVLAREEILRDVNEAIKELPPRQRTAVMLFDVQGWSIRQIAEELDCSEGAVKFNIFQGRRKLRNLLTAHIDADGNPIISEPQ